MKITEDFKQLTKFERALWLVSLCFITISFFFTPEKDYLSLLASLVGATALIFVAKGFVLGQVLTVVFSLLYGVISLSFNYYGEWWVALWFFLQMIYMDFLIGDVWEKGRQNKYLNIIIFSIGPKYVIVYLPEKFG